MAKIFLGLVVGLLLVIGCETITTPSQDTTSAKDSISTQVADTALAVPIDTAKHVSVK